MPSEIAAMTRSLTIASLFFAAASVAATASLLYEPTEPTHGALSADATDEVTRRGTREPLATVVSDPLLSDQPRRGQRTDFVLSGAPTPEPTADGIRRGDR
jgi:hypothetical protein